MTTVSVAETIVAVTVVEETVTVNVTQPVTTIEIEPGGSRDAALLLGRPISPQVPVSGDLLVYDVVLGQWVPTQVGGLDVVIQDEVPAGSVDGANDTYMTVFGYQAGSLRVYLNGLRQSAGAADDYLEVDGQTFAFGIPPALGDVIRVDYVRA
jgi:hypothetical protein